MAVHPLAAHDASAPYARRARVGEPMWVGLVLRTETRCDRIMSDVWENRTYAVVWDAAEGRPRDVLIDSSDFGREYEADVDATPAAVAAHAAWMAARAAEKAAAEEARLEAQAEDRIREVRRGCRAVVARGRKVARGTEGRVFWLGQNDYGWRAGLETDDGQTVWVALNNLDRVLPPKPEGMGWRDFSGHLAELRAAA